ncbi:terminase small subunit [Magnetospirillum aberrantis]|uniref:Terminase small subunit n=1 Tax=Magnetospirillum aberrantis SpK TaxID=908842 RepID=A0A7C9V086_9PROT|nr:terminase small subunit [Magnetospirillum aberrantis]NFV81295.1 hypothetical protein [Magnetospirillum aberrantis SpK]
MTEKQQAFVDAVVRGMTPTDAARAAGYEPAVHAGQIAYRLQRTPSVQAALRARFKARIEGDLVPTALTVIEEIMRDSTQPGGVRLKGAQLTLQAANFLNERGRAIEDEEGARGLSEMTVEELERFAMDQRQRLENALAVVEDLRREAGAQANVITIDALPISSDTSPWE